MMLARKCKRLLAMLMAMVMCLGLVGTSVSAHNWTTPIQVLMSDGVQSRLDEINGFASAPWIHVDNNLSPKGYYEMGPNGWNDNTYGATEDDITGVTMGGTLTSEKMYFSMAGDNGDYAQVKVSYASDGTMNLYCQLVSERDGEPEPEPELQTVYVYAQAKAGQGTVNDSGYFTIGTIQLPLEEATWNDTEDGEGRYAEYENAIANALKNLNKGGYNDWIDPDDVDWYSLKAADGADNYVSSGTMTWHLDGKIKDEVQLYYVTYDLNNGEGTVPTDPKGYAAGQEFKVADGTGLTKDGYEFAGWSTDKKATKPDETFAIPAEGGNVTLYAVWTPKAEPQEGMLRVTKVMELPKGMKLPEDYQVTLKVTEDGTKIGEKTFGYYQLVNGSASFDIYGVEPGEHTYYVDEVVRSSAVEIPSGNLVVDGVAYELKSSGTGYQTTEVVANQMNTALVVTNTYTKAGEIQPQEGMLRVTKVMELPEGMKLPEDYQVTLKVTEDGTKIGEKTFGYYQLVNGSASFDIYGVEPGEHTYYVDEVVRSSAVEIPSGNLVVDGVAYELKSSGTGYQTTEVVANQMNTALVVTNTYTKDETQPPVEGPVLTITKTASASSVEAGGNATYTIEVKNTGTETAKNVQMNDTLPAGLEYVSYEVVSGKDSVVTRGNDVTWQLDDLEPGADVVLKLTVKVSSDAAAATVTNTATATADNADEVSASASFEVKGSTDPDPTPTPTPTPTNPPYVPDDDDDDDPPVVIVDPTTPLGPGTSPEPTTEPTTEPTEEPTEIPEETTPLAPDPGVGDNGDGDDGDADITDGETPLGNLPQTGAVAAPVNPATTAGLVALAFSMAGCGLYFTFGRKKGEEED